MILYFTAFFEKRLWTGSQVWSRWTNGHPLHREHSDRNRHREPGDSGSRSQGCQPDAVVFGRSREGIFERLCLRQYGKGRPDGDRSDQ